MSTKKDHEKASIADDMDNLLEECFIITPIGKAGSEENLKAMGLIEAVIDPVLREFSKTATAAHQISLSGSINNQIIYRLLNDKLVIANLTQLNPNVMYELAVRHAARLPVVMMCQDDTELPFDIKDQRTIIYSDTLSGVEEAKRALRLRITAALAETKPDNPIYQVLEQESIFKELKVGDPLKLIMERLDRMESEVQRPQNSIHQVMVDLTRNKSTRRTMFRGSVNSEKASVTNMSHMVLTLADNLKQYKSLFKINPYEDRDGKLSFEIVLQTSDNNVVNQIVEKVNNIAGFQIQEYGFA